MTTQGKENNLNMIIHPIKGDGTNLNLSSFSKSVEALKSVAGKFHCNDLRIVKLTSNSPISLTIENANDGNNAYNGSLQNIVDGLIEFLDIEKIPLNWTRSTIDAVLELLNPIGMSIGRLDISGEESSNVTLDINYKTAFKNKIEGDFVAAGMIDGMLEAVNIHGKKNALALYPSIGSDKISCEFDDEFLPDVKNMIGQYVEISGEMKYRWRDKYPHFCIVSKISVINENDLPTFSDLFKLSPNATSGVPSEKFIEGIRSEWK